MTFRRCRAEQSHVAAQLDLLMAVPLPAERPEGKMALAPEGKRLFPWIVIKMVALCQAFNLRSWLETSSSPSKKNLGLAVPVMKSSWLLGQQLLDTMAETLPRAAQGWMSEEDKRWGDTSTAPTSPEMHFPCSEMALHPENLEDQHKFSHSF
ncbi:hypothetical protein WISP_86209 [Willisornis vidua]|uniref:Uncharacterized protein n=1 Tax=Willisornis vidua TaxID=1566151 RepID=A0ABQ9D617_9PASS|nr:hypothetical protein WISP_86209 [Willisornis vidua]